MKLQSWSNDIQIEKSSYTLDWTTCQQQYKLNGDRDKGKEKKREDLKVLNLFVIHLKGNSDGLLTKFSKNRKFPLRDFKDKFEWITNLKIYTQQGIR